MIRRWVHAAAEKVKTFILATVVLGALSPATLNAQEVELRLKFEPGADRVYRQVQTTRSSGPMGESNVTQTSTLRQKVLAVADDGAAEVRVTYESIRWVQDGPMGHHQEFDSDSGEPPADPMAMVLSQLVGVSSEMTVAPDGEVRRVAEMDSVTEAIATVVAGHMPEASAMIRPMLDRMFSEENMRSMMQQSMQRLPDGPLAAGATWRRTSTVELPFGTVRSDATYTLEEVVTDQDRRIARIRMHGTTGELQPNSDIPMPAAMEMSDGEMTGQIDFDVERGLILRSSSTSMANMEMSAAGQSMRTESTVEMTLVEDANPRLDRSRGFGSGRQLRRPDGSRGILSR